VRCDALFGVIVPGTGEKLKMLGDILQWLLEKSRKSIDNTLFAIDFLSFSTDILPFLTDFELWAINNTYQTNPRPWRF
jgi:hypothetical protein